MPPPLSCQPNALEERMFLSHEGLYETVPISVPAFSQARPTVDARPFPFVRFRTDTRRWVVSPILWS